MWSQHLTIASGRVDKVALSASEVLVCSGRYVVRDNSSNDVGTL